MNGEMGDTGQIMLGITMSIDFICWMGYSMFARWCEMKEDVERTKKGVFLVDPDDDDEEDISKAGANSQTS